MMTTPAGARTDANATARETPDAAHGWYLYGITTSASLASVLAEADDGCTVIDQPGATARVAAPLQVVDCAGLAAVVRPVDPADFGESVLRERLQSPSALEVIVRNHNRVIEAIHARQAILPAKFGMVYAYAAEIESALRAGHDTLVPQLRRLEECDEWAVHLYADRSVVRNQVSRSDATLQRLREEYVTARPGRAYFLERQIRDGLETATRLTLVTLAQRVYDRLSGAAIAVQVNPVGPVEDAGDEVEILRAAVLVARREVERFAAEVRSAGDVSAGLRCTSSGPWAPYTFAVREDEGAV